MHVSISGYLSRSSLTADGRSQLLQHGGFRFRYEPHEHGDIRRPGPEPLRRPLLPGTAPETTNSLHAGADLRARTTLQAAEIPLRAGAGTPSQHDRPDADPGENLVPEPSLQDEEIPEGQREDGSEAAATVAQTGRSSGSGQGWEAVYRKWSQRRRRAAAAAWRRRHRATGTAPHGTGESAATQPARRRRRGRGGDARRKCGTQEQYSEPRKRR